MCSFRLSLLILVLIATLKCSSSHRYRRYRRSSWRFRFNSQRLIQRCLSDSVLPILKEKVCPKVIDCGQPPPPGPNALLLDVTSQLPEGITTYACESGYIEETGDKSKTCLASGQWSGSESCTLQCVAIDCGDPPAPGSNVQIGFENTLFEGTATYSCPSGYNDDGGQKSVTCLASGQWSGSAMDIIQCLAIDCGYLPTPGFNVEIDVDNTLFEGTATYSCPSGFNDDGGQKSVTCLASGQWSGSAMDMIQCLAIDCGYPPIPGSNVQISVENTLFEGTVTYSCPSGYVDDGGQKSLTCLASGHWSASGQWSASAVDIIQCVAIDCGEPPESGSNVQIDFDSTLFEGTVTYSCPSGYIDDGGQKSVTCLASGQWSASTMDIIQCLAIDCGDPPTPRPNVQIGFVSSLFDSTVTYSCPSGYNDDGGQKSVTCLASGQWSGSAMDIIQCLAINCGEPPASGSNVQIDVDSTLFEGSATYSCPSGYVDDGGQKSATCLASGQWSASTMDIIQCLDCGDPPTPGKDAIIDQLIGGTVTYRCETGSRVSGQVSVTCLTSGQWSSSESDLLQCAG